MCISLSRLVKVPFSRSSKDTFYDLFIRNHIPTTGLEKTLLLIRSTLNGIRRPADSNSVACITEITGKRSLIKLHQLMADDPEGSKILKNRLLIDSTVYSKSKLRMLPKDSLGRKLVEFLDIYNFKLDRPPVRYVDDEDLAYVMYRHRQMHDILHVAFELNVTVEAEVALKCIEMMHSGMPMSLFGSIFGLIITPILRIRPIDPILNNSKIPIKSIDPSDPIQFHPDCDNYEHTLYPDQKEYLYPVRTTIKELLPWAYNAEKCMKRNIYTVIVENWFDKPLSEFQDYMGIKPPPPNLSKYTRIRPHPYY
ncbi:coenzyme Q biosynthesis protein COQ4, putative [Cryptosporidium muris RN66]|uniref:Ubiquinone biosynthesis protein COQ4 homolog, mitochondrial n=1 Tax=Cryptosporidium muris (strain RN66) TaxID=441375 RepID=B6AFX9_CRYMR|nr:coenzyme Q biosynthesis protein COQ4, putative [Cryptosporidium muris RN66]EEA07120.1 coenzyme Q biosynthesis protein COQ4, putative [Cryptosporidium muris RN66]|eukprot:XP_002141469.1 coenzyme Q biosynthesis protein COQ4 [Cryptosporidium muris RN66]